MNQDTTQAPAENESLKKVLEECRALEADCRPTDKDEFATIFRRRGIEQCIAVIEKAMGLEPSVPVSRSRYASGRATGAPTRASSAAWLPPVGDVTPVTPLRVNVDTLEGAALDYWAARASKRWDEGWLERHRYTESIPKLSSDWNEGGPLTEELGIGFTYEHDTQAAGGEGYTAAVYDYDKPVRGFPGIYERRAQATGRSPLVAACRALVKSEFGPVLPAEE